MDADPDTAVARELLVELVRHEGAGSLIPGLEQFATCHPAHDLRLFKDAGFVVVQEIL